MLLAWIQESETSFCERVLVRLLFHFVTTIYEDKCFVPLYIIVLNKKMILHGRTMGDKKQDSDHGKNGPFCFL